MKIYDISQEVFGCCVFPGDPAPEKERLSSIENGELYNLTAFSMCAHNGTHIDAPCHFVSGGVSVDAIPLEKTVGAAYVAGFDGTIGADDARAILRRASEYGDDTAKRILIKGAATVSLEAAHVFAESGVYLVGNESQTVGPEEAPMTVHLALLSAEVALLEGVRLREVPVGAYFLCAAPLSLGGSDGAPCRALLIADM